MKARLMGTADSLHLGEPLRRARRLFSSRAEKQAIANDESLKRLVAFSLHRSSNCVDVGAHVGEILSHIVRVAPDGRHLAYEPLPELAQELQARFPQVDVRCAALSDEAGESAFVRSVGAPALSGLLERDGVKRPERITVRTERLDDALSSGWVPDLIKIDVEGAELRVLRGARKTICAHRPIVVFEHGLGSAERYGSTPELIWDALVVDAGLRLFDLEGAGPYSLVDFERAFTTGAQWNFVAHR